MWFARAGERRKFRANACVAARDPCGLSAVDALTKLRRGRRLVRRAIAHSAGNAVTAARVVWCADDVTCSRHVQRNPAVTSHAAGIHQTICRANMLWTATYKAMRSKRAFRSALTECSSCSATRTSNGCDGCRRSGTASRAENARIRRCRPPLPSPDSRIRPTRDTPRALRAA
jgi:hypothetical protein